MGVLRPATPGFLVTLTATVLLVVVVFCVPYFKSIYFLKASFSESGVNGEITLGTLGYCFTVNNVANCSSPSVGYEFDPNKLLGNDLPIQIPEVAVKWLTYALVLHVVALGFAAVATVFGLLAHVREMSMACCSSCFSGGAAAITLIAFIFDMVFFYVAKGRINKVQGGSATMGTAIWLTLAAWLLLFFAGCFYTAMPGAYGGGGSGNGDRDDAYNTSLRMAAIKAEAERKALAASQQREQGLPAFEEYERTPLRQQEEEHYADVGPAAMGAAGAAAIPADVRRGPSGYSQGSRQPSEGHYPGGYASGAPGTRAMDNYYNPATSSNPAGSGYPPTSSYANAAPPAGAAPAASYSVGAVYGATPTRQQSGSYADRYAPQTDAYQDPYAAAGHQQQASYDPYAQHPTGKRNQ
ncbi:pali-domain-containing protein [Clavulina sp. PMI_390]|nr:pali-domain-containing protein [Clavulina sp. PMI_390]